MGAIRLARLMNKSAKAERVCDIRPGLAFPAKAPDLTQADGRPQLPESLGPQVITSLVERIRDATARAEASLGIVDLSTSAAAAAQERARIAKTNSARARVRSTTASPDLFGLHTPEQTLANREY